MSLTPEPLLRSDLLEDRDCPHCQVVTPQIEHVSDTCLQCIADGGTCCSLDRFNRWVHAQVQGT